MKLRRNRFVPTWRIKNIHVEIFDFPRGDDYDTCMDATARTQIATRETCEVEVEVGHHLFLYLCATHYSKKRGGLRYARPPACYFHYD